MELGHNCELLTTLENLIYWHLPKTDTKPFDLGNVGKPRFSFSCMETEALALLGLQRESNTRVVNPPC